MYNRHKKNIDSENRNYLHKELRQHKWFCMLLPYLACISQVTLSLIMIFIPKLVLDSVQLKLPMSEFSIRIIALCALLAVVTILNLLLHNETEKVSQSFLYRRLKEIWERKMVSMDYEVFLSQEGKVKIEKARNVISSPNWGVVSYLGRYTAVLEAITGLIAYSFIVGKLHILMLLLLTVLFFIELGLGLIIEKKKMTFRDAQAKADRKLNYIAYGTRGMKEAKDIRIYSLVPMLRAITKAVIANKNKVEGTVQKWQFLHMLLTALIILIRDSIAYLFLIYIYLNGNMTIGDFSMYFAAITGIGMWLNKLADSLSDYKEVLGFLRDFMKFKNLPESNSDKLPLQIPKKVSFRLENVSYSYQTQTEEGPVSTPVLQDLNLNIAAGEKIAIVGVNGAGKTTLIKLLCGMLAPSAGHIYMNQTDIAEINRISYYELFSAVFQKSKLLPSSIADNIMLDAKKPKDPDRMWSVLAKAGLIDKVKSLPKQENTRLVSRITDEVELSGGQEQRLLLARALYKEAPVLLLDEPTAALDPISESQIYEKYSELTEGKTAFFVSHRLASTRFCDRIIFLENGKITENGTHDELLALGGSYADMFHVQSKYYSDHEETPDAETLGKGAF